MGYVEPLPSGRYRGVPWNAVAGKRGRSQSFDRWSEADAYWRAAEAEMDGDYTAASVEVIRQQRGIIPLFAEYIIEWSATVDGELSTRAGAASHARQWAKQWPTQRIDEITRPMVKGAMKVMADAGLKAGTREHRLSVLRQVMAAAIEDGHRDSDPTIGVKAPKVPEQQDRILTELELMILLVCLPAWLWAAALLSHDAGLRIQEVCGLRMCNLNLLHGTVTIADVIDIDGSVRSYPKGKTIRDVPLSARCLAALRDHVRDHPPRGTLAPVFAHPRGGHLRPPRVREEWDKALRLARLDGPKPTWHDLRHGCATTLAEAGASPWVIKEILGHGSIATSQRYVRRADLGAQAAAVGRAFGAAETPASAEPVEAVR